MDFPAESQRGCSSTLNRPSVFSRALNQCRRALVAVREFHDAQVELQERWWLSNQPWLEDRLHWSYDGAQWRLHGHIAVPGGSQRSVTRDGWCPGLCSAHRE